MAVVPLYCCTAGQTASAPGQPMASNIRILVLAKRFFSGEYERHLLAGAGHFHQRKVPSEVLAELARFFDENQ